MQYDKITDNIRNKLRNYITTNKIESLVIGLSGGIDSAVCAALAKPVCDEHHIDLIGVNLPTSKNKDDEIERALNMGKLFCSEFEEYDINKFYNESLYRFMDHPFEDESKERKIRRGNIAARLRMIMLYDIAQQNHGLVLSTDNYTEYLLGFWTLHGDVGDYGMIQNLWKTEVYKLAHYLHDKELSCDCPCHDGNALHIMPCCPSPEKRALYSCIKAVPTDGLGITSSDLEQLGAPTYEEVDKILKQFLCLNELEEGNVVIDLVVEAIKVKDHPVVKRHLASEYKRNNPINISREDLFK